MARSVRRRQKQRLYWVEIGFLILGLIALRPSLVTDLVAMGRSAPAIQGNDPSAVGFRSYYPNWNQPTYQMVDPRLGTWNPAWQPSPVPNYPPSNVAWPDAQVHQRIHNGETAPHVASPTWNTPIPNRRY
ncbi:MAG: hypothetical protein ACK553_14085 [Planctomycetota bacterium]|jgi:hypothetical protein